jgi:hypothetical protein
MPSQNAKVKQKEFLIGAGLALLSGDDDAGDSIHINYESRDTLNADLPHQAYVQDRRFTDRSDRIDRQFPHIQLVICCD